MLAGSKESKLEEVVMRIKPKAKESVEPMFIENNNKTSKGREGWEVKNFRMVELSTYRVCKFY